MTKIDDSTYQRIMRPPLYQRQFATLFEDNVVCIAHVKGVYIRGDRTKHISLKFFHTHELEKSGEIDVQQIRSSDNLADLFTKVFVNLNIQKVNKQY